MGLILIICILHGVVEIPQEYICQVEVGELGKIVELGRENAKEV